MTLAVDIELPQEALAIRQGTHWRLRAHPVQFSELRIPTPASCREVVERAQVLVRPIDPYPAVEQDRDGREAGPSWSASWEDWTYWRMHQSGQFIHLLRTPEASHPEWEAEQRARMGLEDAHGLVEAYWAFETLLKFFRFSGRLGNIICPGEELEYSVELVGIKGHLLFSQHFRWPPRRHNYFCKQRVATIGPGVVASEVLFARADDLAISAALRLYEQFGWSEANERLLRTYVDAELA